MKIALLLLCLSANAATYYVDFAGGADSNNGTSTATPFKRIKGMTGCTSACASTTLAAGDIVIFKGGVTWTASFPWTVSGGSAGGRVTYTTDHAWYTGGAWSQPTFDDQAADRGATGMATFASYTTANDLRWMNCGQSLTAEGTWNENKCLNGMNLREISLTNSTFATESWINIYFVWDTAGSYSNFVFTGNDFSKTSGALWMATAAANIAVHNVTYNGNAFHDFSSQIGYDVHGDGAIHWFTVPAGDTTQYMDGFEFANNRFYGDFRRSAGTTGAMTGFLFFEGGAAGRIYNNDMSFYPVQASMFDSIICLEGEGRGTTGNAMAIYNNSILSPSATNPMSAAIHISGGYSNVTLKNNIISGMSYPIYLEDPSGSGATFVSDYNQLVGTMVWNASFQDLATWQAAGRDTHSIGSAVSYVSATNPVDLHLVLGSPAIGAGTNLSGLGITLLNSDRDSVARGSSWDIGSYQYASGAGTYTGGISGAATISGKATFK